MVSQERLQRGGAAAAVGGCGEAVFQSADDPNDITVMLDFATIETAHAFTNDEEFRTALQKAGVTGTPTTWFTSRV